MSRTVTFAATQLTISWDIEANMAKAENAIRDAHAAGAQVILLQELFEAPYFCKTQQYRYLDLAKPLAGNPLIERFAHLAAELEVVLPISYYERDTNTFFNSLVMIDADGTDEHVRGAVSKAKFNYNPKATIMNATISASLLERTKAIEPWIVEIRRRLHQSPELLYELQETAKIVKGELDKLGISYQSEIAETGIVATIGKDDSKCIALRADMDALPIHEEADVEFRSQTDGKMHACGHDCHTAMLLGAARLLKEMEADLKGTVKLFFQPAEEGGAGAERMCQQGAMENPKVEKVFGIHVWPMLPTGMLTGRPGPFLASTSSFKITVTGKGGHAAMPHFAIDPVATSAKIILEAQTLVSREQDPLEACVISFTTINGGTVYNVIPEEVVISGTIRSLSSANKDHLKKRLSEVAEGIAKINRCEAKLEFPGVDYPATSNDPTLWNEVHEMCEQVIGPDKFPICDPMMGGEDFAFYGDFAPTCFVAVGSRNEAEGCTFGLHHPKFKADESMFHIGTALHLAFALNNVG